MNTSYNKIVFVVLVMIFSIFSENSSPETLQWTDIRSDIKHPAINYITYADGKYIAVGKDGAIRISPDGTTWSAGTNPIPRTLHSVAFAESASTGQARFVAVGDSGVIVYSEDGNTWNLADYIGEPLYSVAWGNGQFLAVGKYLIVYSADGKNWITSRELYAHLRCVTFENSMFVVVGNSDSAYLTKDGKQFEAHLINEECRYFSTITYGADKFVAIDSMAGMINYSTDGKVWQKSENDISCRYNGGLMISNILWTGKQFVLSETRGRSIDIFGSIYKSDDGVNWSKSFIWGGLDVISIASNGTEYIAALDIWDLHPEIHKKRSLAILDSSFELTLLEILPNLDYYSSFNYKKILWDTQNFIAFNNYGTTTLTPLIGDSFSNRTINNLRVDIRDVATDGKRYAILSNIYNDIFISDDECRSWKGFDLGVRTLRSITYGKEFLAVGDSGIIAISDSGSAWTHRKSTYTINLNKVSWIDNQYFALGDSGYILASSDGNAWSKHNSNTKETLRGIVKGNGMLVAVGDRGTTLTSSDAITWNAQTVDTALYLSDIAWGNGLFVATGKNKTILVSPDGINWRVSMEKSIYGGDLFSVCFGDERFLVGAYGNALLLSDRYQGVNLQKKDVSKASKQDIHLGKGFFHYTLDCQKEVSVLLFHLNGRSTVLMRNVRQSPGNYHISYPANLAPGYYIMQFTTGDRKITKPVCISR